MRPPWRATVAVAAILATAWVVVPLPADPPIPFVTPKAAEAAPVRTSVKLDGPTTAAVRYAYKPSCSEQIDRCQNWTLVAATGERWWVPGADVGNDQIALSPDGTRLAYQKGGRYVVRDLRAGTEKKLAIKAKDSVSALFGAQMPLFSLDGRHLLVRHDHLDSDVEPVLEDPLIVDVRWGTVRRIRDRGEVVGWTTAGLALAAGKSTATRPGHVSSVSYVIRAPTGAVVRRIELPGNLSGALPSPSGGLVATLADEVTPRDVINVGVVLVDATTGRTVRTVVPRLPTGRQAEAIVRWEGEHALVIRSEGLWRGTAYHILDLATGATRPFDVRLADVVNLPLDPVALAVLIGAVR